LAAWRAILELHRTALPLLDAELSAGTPLDLQQYDALLHVLEAGPEGIRMTDLARGIVLSKSGLTALVDRLENDGLVRRTPDPDDRRAYRIVLTEEGEAAFRSAASVHEAGIHRHVTSKLSRDEAVTIATALRRVEESLRPGAGA